ncbi:MAG TPA: AMP-binding protein [Bryobacteraceae bacterium]|jgi:long-chain acyl-CoA synthetase|nr:AMP-binding protein [Bryobacteraceae bacterium]
MNLGDLLRARGRESASSTALFCRDRAISYAELDTSSEALAGWLLQQGLQPGDRVAIQWPNEIEAVQLYFAIFKAGLIAVPLNLRLKPGEIAWILENSGAKICFSHPMLAEGMKQAAITLFTAVPEAQAGGRTLPAVPEDSVAVILYTSGSTGRPRGAVHTHRTLIETTRIMTGDFLATYGTGIEFRGLIMTPMMHASGVYMLLGSLWAGQPCVLLPLFDPAAVLDAIEKYRCAHTLTLPALMQFIVEEQERRPRDMSSLRIIFAGGDSVPVALQQRVREVLGVEMLEGLAQTETGPSISNPLSGPKQGSIGRAVKGVEVRVVDATGKDVADGGTGELLVRSPAVCTGYWGDAAATGEAIRDGWFHTGDLVTRDPEGYFWFQGRKKEIIIRGGSNISPQEVEEALYRHPEILEAGVVGMPHAVWGEQVVAFVALRQGSTAGEEAIRTHAREHLADYKVPEKVHFKEVLPKGATGKVHRKALKDELLKHL